MSGRPPRARREGNGTHSGPGPWSRVNGTVYGLRCMDAEGRRTLFLHRLKMRIEYVGMYSGDPRERVRQHLYGGGPHHCKPKPFADLIPGWDRNARTEPQQRIAVERAFAEGGAVVLWQKRTWHWRVKLVESWMIFRLLPAYNILENTVNRRHVPKWEQERQRRQRDLSGGPRVVPPASPRTIRGAGYRVTEDGPVTWFGWYGSETYETRAEFESRPARKELGDTHESSSWA
jgi:hypothetical protein